LLRQDLIPGAGRTKPRLPDSQYFPPTSILRERKTGVSSRGSYFDKLYGNGAGVWVRIVQDDGSKMHQRCLFIDENGGGPGVRLKKRPEKKRAWPKLRNMAVIARADDG
jgi:hypothetical protein